MCLAGRDKERTWTDIRPLYIDGVKERERERECNRGSKERERERKGRREKEGEQKKRCCDERELCYPF